MRSSQRDLCCLLYERTLAVPTSPTSSPWQPATIFYEKNEDKIADLNATIVDEYCAKYNTDIAPFLPQSCSVTKWVGETNAGLMDAGCVHEWERSGGARGRGHRDWNGFPDNGRKFSRIVNIIKSVSLSASRATSAFVKNDWFSPFLFPPDAVMRMYFRLLVIAHSFT